MQRLDNINFFYDTAVNDGDVWPSVIALITLTRNKECRYNFMKHHSIISHILNYLLINGDEWLLHRKLLFIVIDLINAKHQITGIMIPIGREAAEEEESLQVELLNGFYAYQIDWPSFGSLI